MTGVLRVRTSVLRVGQAFFFNLRTSGFFSFFSVLV